MISLLINTINRYDNLHKILEQQLEYECINEIIIMNNGGVPLKIEHPKLKVVTPSWDVGLRSRWILAAMANNEFLCFQDDDLIVSGEAIEMLYSHSIYDPDKIYGIYGRQLDVFDRYRQDQFFFGDVDIVLTRLAMIHKKNVPYIFEAERRLFGNQYPQAKDMPYDDILLSYVVKSIYNKKPKAVPVADDKWVIELPTESNLHTSNDFMEKRSDIIRKCKVTLTHENVLNATIK